MGCDARAVAAAVRAAAAVVTAHRDELVRLDQAIGDGDHGENLKRGFGFVVQALDESTPDTPGAVLKLVATTLISKVGGAAGPLYGTAFLRAATAVGDATELTPELVAKALRAALEGVVARGKAEVGDKTMVDALAPAAEVGSLAAAATAAERGAESTIPLVARKGRASYLGERAIGHQDPGARSTALVLRAFAEAAS
ncbi:dihydroxyacetone kinase subunit DhaL [Actinokineospora auranticolor]|uniref:Dihydroxyacetone kinase-like protein n=1 Tax=Actinokineospora auranticolor TaxID=155976 RepID=A0A2S6GG62_9PSEU|nr:dihydroxyacetone kinase subunit DhaL [Actinokineospora auranticolor]PPK64228.1 dihydroxyacetone kinase-like protein [Actinokineospora auranticolor]